MDPGDQLSAFYAESQSLSPQASTDEKSLHHNWQQNKESLQKRLSIRRPVDDLVNNGIMMSPLKTPSCYAERMRQLERAKTTDILKQKIQHRPDAQSLVDRHILPEWPPDEIGASPQVFEMQQQMRRTELMSSLNAKLTQRPGSLEMAEKGLLPLALPMQTMLREGSISYPRVDDAVSDIEELEEEAFAAEGEPCSELMSMPMSVSAPLSTIVSLTNVCGTDTMSTTCTATTTSAAITQQVPSFLPAPSPAPSEVSSVIGSVSTGSTRRVRNHTGGSRSRKSAGGALGTSKVGNFVFHTYCPPAKSYAVASPAVPKEQVPEPSQENMMHANIARQIQQEEYLRLQESEVKQNVLMQQLVQDIRSRHEGRPEPRPSVLQAPAPPGVSVAGSSFVPVSGLASLNVQQLKDECRRYKVPRSGNKLNLIRHLEPFQKEILKRYVMSAQTSPTVSPASNHVAMTVGQLTTNGFRAEDQSMRHSSSAPQLNVNMTGATTNGTPGDLPSVQTTSPASQWSQQPTAVILLNQAGQMTLQPATVLLTQQGLVSATAGAQPPPPPPPPPSSHGVLLRQQPQAVSPPQPPNPPAVVLTDDICDEEEAFVKKVEELERLIVQNIQESDAFKAAHNGTKAEYLERQRQVLMANYSSTKRQAKQWLLERTNEARQHLIKLCESEDTVKGSGGDSSALEAIERERELVLQKYNRLGNALNKINANATPNTSVSSESRVRSLTDSVMCTIPSNLPINRSMTVSEAEPSRGFPSNGSAGDAMHLEVKRLPSVEFQILNEVINEDHVSASKPTHVVLNGTMQDAPISDVTYWLNGPVSSGHTAMQGQVAMVAQPQQIQHLQPHGAHVPPNSEMTVQNGCLTAEVPPMSPLQMDFSSRCSTPQRAGLPAPAEPDENQGQFNFDFLCSGHGMDIAFPSVGGHPSAASMTEPILTPNTQNALYQLIQPDVVCMETDNDSVFS